MQWMASLSDIIESKGRFLVNNILMSGSACLVMAQIQFSLIKKIKVGRPEHSLTPTRLRLLTSHFCLNSPQSGRHMWITPNCFSRISFQESIKLQYKSLSIEHGPLDRGPNKHKKGNRKHKDLELKNY